MADSNPISYSDLFTADAWEKAIANVEKLNALLAQTSQGLTHISKANIGDVTGGGKKLSLDDYKKEEAALNKINAAYEAKKKLMAEELANAKLLIDYKDKLSKANKAEAEAKREEAREEKKRQQEIEKKNKLSREELQILKLTEKANTSAAGSYNQISAKLGLAQIKLKAMSQAQRDNTKDGKILTAQVLAYQNQLIRLDEKVNVHARNVGHYELALGKLGKGIKGVTGILGELGAILGFDIEQMENFVNLGKGISKTLKEIHHVEGLEAVLPGEHGKESAHAINSHEAESNVVRAESAVATEAEAVATTETVIAKEADVVVTEQQAIVTAESTVATEAATVAQVELNTAIYANPYVIALAGLVALVGILAYFSEASDRAKLAEEERSKATDGTIIKNKESRELYNKLIIQNHEFANSIKVATGEISELNAEIDNLKFDNLQKYNEKMSEVKATLIENEGTWNGLKTALTGVDVEFEKAKVKTEELNLEMAAANKLGIEAIRIKDVLALATAHEKNAEELSVLILENRKAQLELLGKETYNIEREILRQKAENKIKEIELDKDAANKAVNIRLQLATDLLGIDKKESDGHLKELKRQNDLEYQERQDFQQRIADLYEKSNDIDERLKTETQQKIDSLKDQKDKDAAAERDLKDEAANMGIDLTEEYNAKILALDQKLADDINDLYQTQAIDDLKTMQDEADAQVKLWEEANKKIADATIKRQQDQLEQLDDFNKAVGKGLDDRIKSQEDAMKIQSQQIESELSVQTELFKEGLDNTLAYEQAEKAKNTREQLAAERKAAKEKKGIELANTYISFLQSYLKDGTDAQSAATKALAQTLIAEGIADAIAGTALEGTEDTGRIGDRGLDGKGGRLWMLHDNERVLTKADNEAIGSISNEELVRRAINHDMVNLYSPNMQMQIPSDAVRGKSNADWSIMIELNGKLLNEVSELKSAFANHKSTYITVDDSKRVIEVVTENQQSKTYIHRDNIFR